MPTRRIHGSVGAAKPSGARNCAGANISPIAVIAVEVTFATPYAIFIFQQYGASIPMELDEAARIDGASAFGTWWRIMVPLAMPAVVVVFLFSVVWHWNDFFEPFIYLNRMEYFTLPMRLSVLSPSLDTATGGQASELFNEALVMAAVFLVILPPLSIYLFTQRFFVESIDRTGLVE